MYGCRNTLNISEVRVGGIERQSLHIDYRYNITKGPTFP